MSFKSSDDEFFVICAGCMKTGTVSFHAAMETLYPGMKCYHVKYIFEKHRAEHISIWYSAAKEKRSLTDEEVKFLMKEYVACADIPAAFYYDDFMRVFPNAKVVLTVRDPQKWVTSYRETIHQLLQVTRLPFIRLLYWLTGLNVFNDMVRIVSDYRLGSDFDGASFEDQANRFKFYNDLVKTTVPKDRLLVYEVSEGWKPLCEFLNRPVPKVLFPKLNETASSKKMMRTMRIINAVFCLLTPVVIGGTIYGGIRLWKR